MKNLIKITGIATLIGSIFLQSCVESNSNKKEIYGVLNKENTYTTLVDVHNDGLVDYVLEFNPYGFIIGEYIRTDTTKIKKPIDFEHKNFESRVMDKRERETYDVLLEKIKNQRHEEFSYKELGK